MYEDILYDVQDPVATITLNLNALRDRTSPAVAGVRERVGPAVEGVRERVEQVSSRIGRADRVPEVDGGPIDAPGPIDDTTEETDKAPA